MLQSNDSSPPQSTAVARPGPYPWAIASEILGIPLNSTLKKLPKTIQLRLLYRARDRPIPVVTTNQ
jgi:hypothetical protein